jgi:hypothetical protein
MEDLQKLRICLFVIYSATLSVHGGGGARGSRVIKAVKLQAGRSRGRDPMRSIFNFLILPAALGPGVHSASNTNRYQKQKNNNVSRE